MEKYVKPRTEVVRFFTLDCMDLDINDTQGDAKRNGSWETDETKEVPDW